MPRAFPPGFRWGTATAAHQVEGGNVNNDWWAWEQTPGSGCVEPSGDTCDQYHRYPSDLALLAALGFDSYRFSIEWSRIEPEEGQFSTAALDHYRRVCAACLEHGLEPTVTFHHFTTPRWATVDGGWSDPAIVDRFGRFCEKATGHLGDLIARACTINEPNIVSFMGYMGGVFPPGCRDRERWLARQRPLRRRPPAGRRGARRRPGRLPGRPDRLDERLPGRRRPTIRRPSRASSAYGATPRTCSSQACRGDDFVGVQSYSRTRVGPDGMLGNEDGDDVLVDGLRVLARRCWPRRSAGPGRSPSTCRCW